RRVRANRPPRGGGRTRAPGARGSAANARAQDYNESAQGSGFRVQGSRLPLPSNFPRSTFDFRPKAGKKARSDAVSVPWLLTAVLLIAAIVGMRTDAPRHSRGGALLSGCRPCRMRRTGPGRCFVAWRVHCVLPFLLSDDWR